MGIKKWRDSLGTVLDFGSWKVRGISGLADELLTSQEVLCSM
jgi:hypothetical protein